MSFYQRSLALFFGELAGPPVSVIDAKDAVAGETVKGLRITVHELGYVSLWYVKNRAWHVARPGAEPVRTVVPGSAVIYQIGTEVVGELLRIAQDAYLQPGGDKPRIESYIRNYEGFLQHNIPQGLASLKAYEGVERARALLEELRREYQVRLAAAAVAPPAPADPAPFPSAPPAAPVFEPPTAPEPVVYEIDLDDASDDDDLEISLTYDAESIAWPPAAPVLEPVPAMPEPAPAPETVAEPVLVAAAPDIPAERPAPAPEPVTVTPQTTASFVFDPELVNLLGRLGSAYPWLLPDYGRHGDGMGVRVTLPAGLSVVFTHLGQEWTVSGAPALPTAAQAVLDADAVYDWAIGRIRELTAAYAGQIGAERPADAAQLFQRVADLS